MGRKDTNLGGDTNRRDSCNAACLIYRDVLVKTDLLDVIFLSEVYYTVYFATELYDLTMIH